MTGISPLLPVVGLTVGGVLSSLLDSQVYVNGILIGGLYALLAIGFSMAWDVIGVINISHGDIMMLGAFATWTTMSVIAGPGQKSFVVFVAGLIVAMVVLGVLGYYLQRQLISRVVKVSDFLTLLLTFGLALIMSQTALLYWSPTPRSIDVALPGAVNYTVLGAVIPTGRLVIFLLALVITATFYLFLHRTRTGRAIRAAGQNEQAAAIVGIDIEYVYGLTFAVAAALAAAAGGLIGMTLAFQPQMGIRYILKMFVVVIIGGLGSIVGALVGGVFLGVVEQMGAAAFGTGFTDAIAFTALVVFLLVRPQGFFGRSREDE